VTVTGNKGQQKIMSRTADATPSTTFTDKTRNCEDIHSSSGQLSSMSNIERMHESSDSSDSNDINTRMTSYPGTQTQNIQQQVVIQNPTGVLHLGPVYNLNIGQAFGQVNTNVPAAAQSNSSSINGKAEDPRERDRPPKEEMRPYWYSERVIEQEELSMISRNMGSNWKAVGNGLKFHWAQLDQFEADTKSMVDAIQRMLFRWVQWKDQKATVGKLTKVLFNHGEYEAIRVLKP